MAFNHTSKTFAFGHTTHINTIPHIEKTDIHPVPSRYLSNISHRELTEITKVPDTLKMALGGRI
jgi:hypothetical protein